MPTTVTSTYRLSRANPLLTLARCVPGLMTPKGRKGVLRRKRPGLVE